MGEISAGQLFLPGYTSEKTQVDKTEESLVLA